MTEVQFEQPKFSQEVLTATEHGLSQHGFRLRPGKSIEDVLDALQGHQCQASVFGAGLALTQNGSACHVAEALENLGAKHPELFFARASEVGSISCKSDCDVKAKIEFIKRNGLEAWRKLPQERTADQGVVVLSPSRLTRQQYQSLPLAQKIEFVRRYGEAGVSAVMSRKK